MAKQAISAVLKGLNREQRQAVRHGEDPLLVVAGAGTGKTKTLVHRVAHLIGRGTDPARILLLTFTRRAANEMLCRVDDLLWPLDRLRGRGETQRASRKVWGGTFHATAARLLRIYGTVIGLDPSFTIHDRGDSEDLIDGLRTELGLADTHTRFPKKGTCMAIYSHCVNSQEPIDRILAKHYAWCRDDVHDLKRLFDAYTDRKDESSVLDYDDLLLFWHEILSDSRIGPQIFERFDAVLVDEYQDTNRLQAEILQMLRPEGIGLTAAGDDAQSIYSFRAATVRNILDFPEQFPGTTIVKLEQNYRSTQSILEATNCVIASSKERHTKELWSNRDGGERPLLATCGDDDEQAEFLVRKVLEHCEAGAALRQQAVLFRAGQNSMTIEAELARHHIPFVKYGGLKFVETAHVKDLMAFLRLAENHRDVVAGTRVLKLLPGVGPKKAAQLMQTLMEAEGDFRCWVEDKMPPATKAKWPKFNQLLQRLTQARPLKLTSQVAAVRKFYTPLLEMKVDNPEPGIRDLEQLEQLAGRFPERRTLLTELALDPPATSEENPGQTNGDEDFLVLSTVHSAKGLEWDAVFIISATDANFPLGRANADTEQVEEERRLFYVALTRAKNWLCVCFPMRSYQPYRGESGDPYGLAQLTRFITKGVKRRFRKLTVTLSTDDVEVPAPTHTKRHQVRQRVRSMWQ
ncbi:MAG: ATP-dependent helicase [Pirellulaceae bacterium]